LPNQKELLSTPLVRQDCCLSNWKQKGLFLLFSAFFRRNSLKAKHCQPCRLVLTSHGAVDPPCKVNRWVGSSVLLSSRALTHCTGTSSTTPNDCLPVLKAWADPVPPIFTLAQETIDLDRPKTAFFYAKSSTLQEESSGKVKIRSRLLLPFLIYFTV